MVITGEVNATGDIYFVLKTPDERFYRFYVTANQMKEAIRLIGKQVKITIEEDLDTRHERWDETV